MTCPGCGGTNTSYAAFSGGREMYCADCEDNFALPADLPPDQQPRAALLRTEAGRIALRAQMDQELARRRDQVRPPHAT